MAQLQQLLAAPGSGPVNWDLARQVAASQLAAAGDPAVSHVRAQRGRGGAAPGRPVARARPRRCPPASSTAVAWNRNEWIYNTLDVWRKLCDPVAGRMVGAMGDLVPEEVRAQLGPMQSMVASLGGALFGGQLGQALGSLAAEVLSAGDIGLPLGPAGTAALIPANIQAYGEGLELPEDQVRLYVALREAAHQRLFGHVPWLRGHVLSAVETYAAGITGQPGGDRGGDGPGRPDRPRVDAGDGRWRASSRPRTPRRRRPRWPGWRPRSPWSRAGSATSSTAPPATGCPTSSGWARRSAAAGPPAVRPSRPSPRWSAWSCARAGCARPRRSGRRSPSTAASPAATPSGATPTCCPTDDDFADPDAFAMNDMDLSELDSFDFTAPSGVEETGPRPVGSARSVGAVRVRPGAVRSVGAVRSARRDRRRRATPGPDVRASTACAPGARRSTAGTRSGEFVQVAVGFRWVGPMPESRARVASQPSKAGSSVARSAGPRSRRQPVVTATSPGRGASARASAGVAVSRSSVGSQSGAGSRTATPSRPGPPPSTGATATGRLVSGRSSLPTVRRGQVRHVTDQHGRLVVPLQRGEHGVRRRLGHLVHRRAGPAPAHRPGPGRPGSPRPRPPPR